MNEGKIIAHLDLNAFFAAVEEKNNPALKGKPVIVGADPKGGSGRGVVSTCNYEARKYGVRSAMPISKAYSLCPQGVFVPVNYELYTDTSLRVMDILRSRVTKVEQVSIDESACAIQLGDHSQRAVPDILPHQNAIDHLADTPPQAVIDIFNELAVGKFNGG